MSQRNYKLGDFPSIKGFKSAAYIAGIAGMVRYECLRCDRYFDTSTDALVAYGAALSHAEMHDREFHPKPHKEGLSEPNGELLRKPVFEEMVEPLPWPHTSCLAATTREKPDMELQAMCDDSTRVITVTEEPQIVQGVYPPIRFTPELLQASREEATRSLLNPPQILDNQVAHSPGTAIGRLQERCAPGCEKRRLKTLQHARDAADCQTTAGMLVFIKRIIAENDV